MKKSDVFCELFCRFQLVGNHHPNRCGMRAGEIVQHCATGRRTHPGQLAAVESGNDRHERKEEAEESEKSKPGEDVDSEFQIPISDKPGPKADPMVSSGAGPTC